MKFFRLCILAILAWLCLASLSAMARLAWMQLRHPILFVDSWTFTHRPPLLEWQNFLRWLVAPHAFHRITIPKALSVVETELFHLPPATTNLLQSLLLALLCSGVVALIAHKIAHRSTAFIAWLTATALLFNHWQSENFWWEFQTPWLFINMLTLVATLLLLRINAREKSSLRAGETVVLALTPWAVIYSCGQGIAMAGALVACSYFVSRRLAVITALSSALALGAYYFLLPYSSPTKTAFSLKFWLVLMGGSVWQGMAVVGVGLLVLLAFQLRNSKATISEVLQNRGVIAALALPAVYAIFFAVITTLARSEQGIGLAYASRYVTPLIMLPLSGILLSAWLSQWSQGLPSTRSLIALAPAVLLLIGLMVPAPAGLDTFNANFVRSWDDTLAYRTRLEEGFRCSALQSLQATKGEGAPSPPPCTTEDGAAAEGVKYFKGAKALKPRGWHQQLLASPLP